MKKAKKTKRKITTGFLLTIIVILIFSSLISITIIKKSSFIYGKNLIKNGGFEKGANGWSWLSWSSGWAAFEISNEKSRTGKMSALLPVSSAGETRRTIVWGVVQEVEIGKDRLDCIEGYYYVDSWKRGASNQYIQAVIIDLSRKLTNGNAQIRYILSGVQTPPYNLSNARYIFLDPERKTFPPLKKWIRFKSNPFNDFKIHWGYEISQGHRLRVLFEARFDNHAENDPEAKADVYFDDLYIGPSSLTHCKK